MVDSGTGLDTECTFQSDGPLIIDVPVKRYLGPTNGQGTLTHARALVANGLLGRYAILTLPALDVDYYCDNPPCERDRVFFNDVMVVRLASANHEYLQGVNNGWTLNRYIIPIECVRFPGAPGEDGNEPAPALNRIRIDIDVDNGYPDGWCTAIDWVALQFKCMSPVVLIHGTGSSPAHFTQMNITGAFDRAHILWDNSIATPISSTASNAVLLYQRIPLVARSFGVDSVHLVAHSKGGLECRDYLERFYPRHRDQLRVLSLTTLSTPHSGSVLADVSKQVNVEKDNSFAVEFPSFPAMTSVLTMLAPYNEGHASLTQAECSAFNSRNIPGLPTDCDYVTVAADADLNGNGRIDWNPDEFYALRVSSPHLVTLYAHSPVTAAEVIDTMYQILGKGSTLQVMYEKDPLGRQVATVVGAPSPQGFRLNDTFVTIDSALGPPGYRAVVAATSIHVGTTGRNHSDVADFFVGASDVIPRIRLSEAARGDLK